MDGAISSRAAFSKDEIFQHWVDSMGRRQVFLATVQEQLGCNGYSNGSEKAQWMSKSGLEFFSVLSCNTLFPLGDQRRLHLFGAVLIVVDNDIPLRCCVAPHGFQIT
uniref:Uncharacterized protein n=1 Tax=Physcomitrium patens TaxID=3218 RepID=A0A2K1JCV4_PHYPA|nr:hypothetical protein PHYPA_019635 [Physcomitrium patens]